MVGPVPYENVGNERVNEPRNNTNAVQIDLHRHVRVPVRVTVPYLAPTLPEPASMVVDPSLTTREVIEKESYGMRG